MTPDAAQSFAVWLLNTHPALFYAIAKQQNPSLSGLSDVLSNIGGAFSNAISSVGNWVGNSDNVKSLTSLAGTYFNAQSAGSAARAQQAVLQTQLSRAQSGQAAAPIAYAYNAQGQPVPVYTGTTPIASLGAQTILPSGQVGYQITPQALQTLSPSFLQKYGLWLGLGGAAAFVALLFRSRS